MLQSLKQKTLVGKLWAIIVLAVAAIFIGVVFGPGVAKMIAGPTYFAPRALTLSGLPLSLTTVSA